MTLPEQKQISFLHAADLHLDTPFKGLARVPEAIFKEIQESTFMALNRLVETAIDKQVDLILLVGDLFDNERPSLKAQIKLRDLFVKLNHHHISVFISYGNHDYINGNRYPITYPDNVFIFPDETVRSFIYEKDGEKLAAIYGFSYENQAVLTNKAQEFVIHHNDIPFHIAMLHGSLHRNTEHDTYAPFAVADLKQQPFDYWALGHIHQRETLAENPPIIYPGNTQGRHRKEAGEKGCYYTELTQTGIQSSFIPLQSIQFHTVTLDISSCKQAEQLTSVIENTVTDKRNKGRQLISLVLTSSSQEHQKWETDGIISDCLELVNESFLQQVNWVYIYQHQLEQVVKPSEEMLAQGEHFFGELVRHAENTSIKPFISELYQHRQARKYLPHLANDEEELIKQKAQQYLLQELLNQGGDPS